MPVIRMPRPSGRALLLSTLTTMLVLSLACSQVIRAGHADAPIAATAEDIRPLAVGDRAPRFTIRDVNGDNVEFDPDKLERPAIIITFRGGWCPFCNMHLSELRNVIPEISAAGIDVMFLSGDRPELLYASLENETQADIDARGYSIYSDADVQAAIALGIAFRADDATINRRYEKGQDIGDSSMLRHGILPVPAVFAVGADGTIEFVYVNPDYKVRLPADELAAVAMRLVGG